MSIHLSVCTSVDASVRTAYDKCVSSSIGVLISVYLGMHANAGSISSCVFFCTGNINVILPHSEPLDRLTQILIAKVYKPYFSCH